MGTFSGVMTGLSAIERRTRYVTLKYKGIPGSMFDNVCYPSVGMLLGRLDSERKRVTEELAALNKESKATKAKKWYLAQNREKKAELDKLLKELRRLVTEIELDLSRYSPSLQVPVCLALEAQSEVHEVVHAAIANVLPKYDASGKRLSTNAMMVRMLVIRKATLKFLSLIGPKSRDFFQLVHPHIKLEHSEEIVAGLAGLVALVARQDKGVDVSAKWGDTLDAFASYTHKAIPTPDFDVAAVAAAREWYAKYGSSITKAIRGFSLDVKAVRAQMAAQQQAMPYQPAP